MKLLLNGQIQDLHTLDDYRVRDTKGTVEVVADKNDKTLVLKVVADVAEGEAFINTIADKLAASEFVDTVDVR